MLKHDHCVDNIILSLLKKGQGGTYYSFSNADGKQWIMPRRNMKTAMNLYQPSGRNGVMFKRCFPLFNSVIPIFYKLGIKIHQYDLCDELKQLLEVLFKAKNIEFALFCGTPSVHQKITMQISIGKRILGYCKFTTKSEIKNIFDHERTILDLLQEKNIRNVPQVLYSGIFKENIDIFVQTTIKTNDSKITHRLDTPHWKFLSTLYEKTAYKTTYIETDLFRILKNYQLIIGYLPKNDRFSIQNAIKKINDIYNEQKVVFCFYHGDFTPWNMFQNNDELFVFDWEYAQTSMPPYMDAFHFFTQTALFEQNLSSDTIFSQYVKLRDTKFKDVINTDIVYLSYLLCIIYQYWNREQGILRGSVKRCYNIWVDIIKQLL